MTDHDTRRAEADQPAPDNAAPPAADKPDRLVEALRDLPKMREIKDDRYAGKVFVPPPPTVSRFGGLAQGCGGGLLILASLPMVMAALWYGYYLWGPALMLSGGLLLTASTLGVWSGRRAPLLAAIAVLIGVVFVGLQWAAFVPAAGALAPLGQLAIVYTPAVMLMALALIAAFIMHAITLVYWKRLKPYRQRALVIWGVAIVVMATLSVTFHFVQQTQRQSWLDDRLDSWGVSAAGEGLQLGGNANVTLGYSFVTVEEDDDNRFDLRDAELQALLASGGTVLRLAAGGDLMLEAETPLMFTSSDEKDGNDDRPADEIEARREARFARQAALEGAYLERVAESGVELFLSDAQYSPYLLVLASDESTEGDSVPWADFARLHEARVRTYAERLQPAYYEVINEPGAYSQFSSVEQIEDDDARLDAWIAHTEQLIAAVREVSPATQIGVGVSLADSFDLDFYERLLAVPGLDFVSFRIFQPAAFTRLEDLFDDYGLPAESGKAWWISETWYGYCLAPQRSMELDGDWLEVAVAFGLEYGAAGVLPSDFGCFIEPGGTLFGNMNDPANRTEVYTTWTKLTARFNG